jgi:hypothetical protein
MWKSNRKDECYDVYLDACQDSFERLLVAENKVSGAAVPGRVYVQYATMTPASGHCWLHASPELATAVLTWGLYAACYVMLAPNLCV